MCDNKKPEASGADELKKIDAILDKDVRPYLQSHGGDLRLVSLDSNVLSVNYQGACGTCPHAISGTLMAIEDVLKKEYSPDITVKPANV